MLSYNAIFYLSKDADVRLKRVYHKMILQYIDLGVC